MIKSHSTKGKLLSHITLAFVTWKAINLGKGRERRPGRGLDKHDITRGIFTSIQLALSTSVPLEPHNQRAALHARPCHVAVHVGRPVGRDLGRPPLGCSGHRDWTGCGSGDVDEHVG